ncbi:MAG: cobalt ECF transporter T component CbiQ [Spirochaetota bacterium]|nr:cobalt ECF transporter T component CbiQ [Spirochaetota bacterium]
MHVDIDKYAFIDSPVHSWDTRCKILTIIIFILCISSLSTIEIALSSMFLSFGLAFISRLPSMFIFKKVWIPFLFLLPLFLFLPVSSGGTVLINLKYINIYYDGLSLSFLILFKAIAIITLFIIMLGTSTFNRTAGALKGLKLSNKLVNLILFTYRYIFVYLETLRKMRTSLILRGFRSKNSIRSFMSTASLIGTLLIRSFEQTEKVYNAMILRGFEGGVAIQNEFKLESWDIIKSGACGFVSILLVLCDFYCIGKI